MPIKKTEVTAASIALTTSAETQQQFLMEGIDMFELPRTLARNIHRSAIPDEGRIMGEANTAFSFAATVFVSYLTATALEVAKSKGHKTLGPADMLKALEMIEFGDQVSRTEDDLDAYRDGAKKPRLRETTGVKKRGGSSKDGGAYKGKIKTPIASHVSPSRPRAQPIIENSDDDGDDPDEAMHDEGDPHTEQGQRREDAGWATDDTGEAGLDEDEEQGAVDEGLQSDGADDDDQLVD